ncbi:hypothetical protein QR680_011003 [Steinernema hermaphroditum]|uniref:Uncharacterized protein n=1 Tax=Steinernema hermaphroditum TaxID=289476 RepID=A0AA39ISA7_9BILA|nr:hypothetical protein QR680_011003 [Steinernema hermaphroditum]
MDLEQLCAEGISLSEDSLFVTIMGLKSFCAFAGVISVLLITYFEDLTKSFHKNARMIVYLHFGMVAISATGSLLSDGYDFLRFTAIKSMNIEEDCSVHPFSARVGASFKLIKIFGTSGIIGTIFAWSLERLCATIFAKSYEKKSSKLGASLCLVAIGLAIVDVSVHLSRIDFSALLSMVSVTKPAIDISMKFYYGLAAIEIVSVLLLGCIWIMNVRYNSIKSRIFSTLAYKSQIQENIEAVSFMFPVAFIHCFFGLTAALIVPSIALSIEDPLHKAKSIAEFDLVVLYYVVLPITLFWRNYVKRKNAKRVVELKVHGDSLNNHFTMLRKLFN